MTKTDRRPYLGECPVCEQGLLRIARCPHCQELSALCDECEAIWKSPRAIFDVAAATQHPLCPHCEQDVVRWQFPSRKQIREAGMEDLIRGKSI